MKSRHLPETEVANLAFKPASHKERVLAGWLKPRSIKGSYNPFRSTAGDAVNRQLPLFPERLVATPWEKLEALVRHRCRGDEELLRMNLPIARATHDFASKRGMTAEPIDIRSISLALGQPYDFGLPLILRYDGGASVAFTDLRRTGSISVHGCRVVHSIMHQRFRVNYPELEGLRLELWKYANNASRDIQVIRYGGEPLYSYYELVADVTETYRILYSLMAAGVDERRRGGGRDVGSFFGT